MAIVTVALCGCGSGQDPDEEFVEPAQQEPLVLTIYVYSPESPVVTRADEGEVDDTDLERAVRSMQIWVFVHNTGELVGYLSPSTESLNNKKSDAFLMTISDDFAQSHPNVDVYVLANNTDESLGAASSRTALEAAVMQHEEGSAFGLKHLTTVVPSTGLPMAGVLRDQPVYGDSPVLRIGTSAEMATVRLLRTVSKMCFYFTRSADATEQVVINSITLEGGLIPTEEFLFLSDDGNGYRIGDDYESENTVLATSIGEPATCDDPYVYLYEAGMEAQTYCDLMAGGANTERLTQTGPFYLRESDRRLSGTIDYQVDGEQREATFEMTVDSNFSRNHLWIVFGYFSTANNGSLELSNVFIRDWSEVSREQDLHNW